MHKMSSMALSGLIMSFLGVVAIIFPVMATTAIDSFLGALFLVSGVFHVVAVLDEKDSRDMVWNVVIAFAFLITGTFILSNDFATAASLAAVLMLFFAIQGVVTIVSAMKIKGSHEKWWWTLLSGICALLIAFLIFIDFPASAGWAVGTFAGIYMILFGVSLMSRGSSFGSGQ